MKRGRPKLGPTENVWLQVRIPIELRDEFQSACDHVGTEMSAKVRLLIASYLRQRAAIKRQKGKSK